MARHITSNRRRCERNLRAAFALLLPTARHNTSSSAPVRAAGRSTTFAPCALDLLQDPAARAAVKSALEWFVMTFHMRIAQEEAGQEEGPGEVLGML